MINRNYLLFKVSLHNKYTKLFNVHFHTIRFVCKYLGKSLCMCQLKRCEKVFWYKSFCIMLSFSNLSQSRDNVRENGMWMSCLSLVKRQVCHINVALLDSSMKETVYVVQLRDSVYLLSTIFVFWAFLQFIQCIRPSRRYFRQAVVVLYSLKNSRYGVRVLIKFFPGLDRPLHVFTSFA